MTVAEDDSITFTPSHFEDDFGNLKLDSGDLCEANFTLVHTFLSLSDLMARLSAGRLPATDDALCGHDYIAKGERFMFLDFEVASRNEDGFMKTISCRFSYNGKIIFITSQVNNFANLITVVHN